MTWHPLEVALHHIADTVEGHAQALPQTTPSPEHFGPSILFPTTADVILFQWTRYCLEGQIPKRQRNV
jgi:hypothetical protein